MSSSRAIDNLIDRIRTNHPASKTSSLVSGLRVEFAGRVIVMEQGSRDRWQVGLGGAYLDQGSFKEASDSVLSLMNQIWADEEDKKPRRESSANSGCSSRGGGGGGGDDAVGDTWVGGDDPDDD